MRLFKPSYRDREGKKQKTIKWYLDFFTPDRVRHKLPLFTDRRACEAFGRRIEELCGLKAAAMTPGPELQRWTDDLPIIMLCKLVSWGLISNQRVAAGSLLSKHLQDWRQSLLSGGCTATYADLKAGRVKRIFQRCRFRTFADISASKVQLEIAKIKRTVCKKINGRLETVDIGPASVQTKNYYLKACCQFTRWMVGDRRASEDPLQHLKPRTAIEQVRRRRSLEVDEARRFLASTAAAGPRSGMDGYQRGLLYRVAIETGLRASELQSLTASSFDFVENTVNVRSDDTKNSKGATLPLRADTEEQIRRFVAGKIPQARVFNLPSPGNMSRMIRADLRAAGIEPENDKGILDFHSLRHTFGTLLAASGIHPKTAQSLMRHSDINLTMLRYTHTLRTAESEAVESLPDLSLPSREKQSAVKTGTDNVDTASPQEKNLSTRLDTKCGFRRTSVDYSGQSTPRAEIEKTAVSNGKQGFCGENQMRVVGIGPTTYGLKGRCSTY